MNRFEKFILEINLDMKRRGIKQKDIIEGTGISSSVLSKTLNGKSLSKETLEKVVEYIDDEKNWKK